MLRPAKKSPLPKIILYIISFLLLYILLPVYLAINHARPSFKLLLLFYLVNTIIIFYLVQKNFKRKYQLEYQIQDLQEKLNILNDSNAHELKINAYLQAKTIRYNNLKKIIEEINRNLDLEYVADSLISITFLLVSNNRGTGILYLVDNRTQKLSLFKTKKEDEKLMIKAKEGDIFDFWVLRHTTPLLVEDIKNDFRFDLEKLKTPDLRPISSLISSPLISEQRFLGILRLDNPKALFYSQDDLRFLATVCDLGAVALENSELFERTQELAINDALTSLYTKGFFLERLKEECNRGIRHNTVFSLLMLDIDFFKNYNNKFGHVAGDIVLTRLSQNITESLKNLNPIPSRFGGEEFCIILQDTDKKKAFSIANALRKGIEKEKIILRRQETHITVSIGVASFPLDATSEDELIQKADKAMYQAKQKGRNQVCYI